MGRILLISLTFASAMHAATGVKETFNRTNTGSYVDPYRGFERTGHDVEADVVALIEQARRRVWLAAYDFRLPKIAKALRTAKEKGVDVRVIVEKDNHFSFEDLHLQIEDANSYEVGRLTDYFAYADLNNDKKLEEKELLEMDAVRILKDAGIPIVDDTADGSKGSGLMHHKFIVIDSKLVFSGSGNFTWSDFHGDKLKPLTRGNANNFFTIESQVINKAFADEFTIMWGDGPEGLLNSRFGVKKPYRAPIKTQLSDGSRLTLQFGATSKTYGWEASPNGLISSHVSHMTESFQAAFFVWSEQKIANLIPQELAPNIQVLIDPFFGYHFYSELLDLLGLEMFSDTCRLEEHNNPWKTPALNSGISYLTEGDRLHHKFAVLDSKKVVTGSHNWSANANENNDEMIILIENSNIAASYQEEIKRLQKHAVLGHSPQLMRAIQAAANNCRPEL